MNRPNRALTERDLQILLMVYNYDGCGIAHLVTRFWKKTVKPYGPRSAAYRRINLLVAGGYLKVDRLPPLSGNGGSGKAFVTLGDLGRKVVARHLGLARSDLRRLREIDTPLMAAHALEISDFRVALEAATERVGVKLSDWTSERQLRQRPIIKVRDPRPPGDGEPSVIPLIPDGEFTLILPGDRRGSFRFENDRGTVAPKRIRARCRAILAHAHKDGRTVLWVVPDKSRQEAIASWAADEARELRADPTIFWITTRANINDEMILKAIWEVVRGPAMALVPSDVTEHPAMSDLQSEGAA